LPSGRPRFSPQGPDNALDETERVSVTARGGGTSQSGQTVNSTLVVDCSKYLDRVIELDVPGRRCVVEPGIVLDELNRKLKPHGLWFPGRLCHG
jgi:FAD/FMN-containing dehydrogenase